MFARPRNQLRVIGTFTICGTAITSPASARRTSQRAPAQTRPSRDDSTCAAVLVASRDASSCWNERRSRRAARVMSDVAAPESAERGDLRQQFVADDGLDEVVAGTLAQPPDLVGLLALGRAHDDRDRPCFGVATDRTRRLEAV